MTYLGSICVVLLIPAGILGLLLRDRVQWRPFVTALSTIGLIGGAWSWVVTAQQWWSFGELHVTGWRLLNHLLLEEVLFYPSGGALCILLYLYFSRVPARSHERGYLAYLWLGTAALTTVAVFNGAPKPYYLYSQLVVYNLLVCASLARSVSARIDAAALAYTTSIMTTVGYLWDHVAFTGGWWHYHAITRWQLGAVPIDDFAFFLFAPAAAISIYEAAHTTPAWTLGRTGFARTEIAETVRPCT